MNSTLKKDSKIVVVYGGDSPEREPSLKSGFAVYEALQNAGFKNVSLFDFRKDRLIELLNIRPEPAFLALHGQGGEDGSIQGALELAGIPYTGSGVAAGAVCMDKSLTRLFLEAAHLPAAKYVVMDQSGYSDPDRYTVPDRYADPDGYTDPEGIFSVLAGQLGLPFLIKPACQGSGIGVSLVRNEEELREAAGLAFQYGTKLLAEEYLQGIEITQSILEEDGEITMLPEVGLVSDALFRSYDVKYTPGRSRYVIPSGISEEERKRVREICGRIWQLLGLRGCARVDMIIDSVRGPVVLEINTLPAMAKTSALPAAARAAGISMEELTEQLVRSAMSGLPGAGWP